MCSNVIKINRNQLGQKIGEIVDWNYVSSGIGENVFVVYMDGEMPVKIRSRITKLEFDMMCK